MTIILLSPSISQVPLYFRFDSTHDLPFCPPPAEALASQVTDEDRAQGLVYPPFTRIRTISAVIATAVAERSYELGKWCRVMVGPGWRRSIVTLMPHKIGKSGGDSRGFGRKLHHMRCELVEAPCPRDWSVRATIRGIVCASSLRSSFWLRNSGEITYSQYCSHPIDACDARLTPCPASSQGWRRGSLSRPTSWSIQRGACTIPITGSTIDCPILLGIG